MTKVQTAEVLDIKISTNQVDKDLKNSYDGKKKLPLRKKTLDDINPDYERDKY